LLRANDIAFDEVVVPALKTDAEEEALRGQARTRYQNARMRFFQVTEALGGGDIPLIVVTGTVIGGLPDLIDWIEDGNHTHTAEFLAKDGYLGQRSPDAPRPGKRRRDGPRPPRQSDRLPGRRGRPGAGPE